LTLPIEINPPYLLTPDQAAPYTGAVGGETMRIFISYASEDRDTAEEVHMTLLGAGHQTFFDKSKLPPGKDYHSRIQAAVMQCDAFIFLITPRSIEPKSYTLTELKIARNRWEHPDGRVLPVMAETVPYDRIPNYLAAVTVLEPEGNLAAEVALAVNGLAVPTPEPHDPGQSGLHGPSVMLQVSDCRHNVPVPGSMGSAQGMQIQISGRARQAAGRQFQVVVRFSVQGGPALFANVQEFNYRDMSGLVATGTPPRPIVTNDQALQDVVSIPYYALNLMPTNGMTRHMLMLTASAYLDNQLVGQSAPAPFFLNW
jgi:hypothetical protein